MAETRGELSTLQYYSSREVDQSAAALNEPILVYPQAALGSRLGGHVVVRIFIAKDGSVKHAEVVRAAPVGTFESAALEAVLRLIFRPALLHGDPVPSRITIEVPFDPYCERPGVCSHRVGTHGLISQ